MTPGQFLLLEDNPLDAEVIRVTLAEGGVECQLSRVETHAQFVKALETQKFDLILADYSLPNFDGLAALKIARERCLDLPFILVSGSMGEELAIEALKEGATDYVLKQRLERLVPCVQRALREAAVQRECAWAEATLRESEARFRSFAEHSNEVIWMTDAHDYRLLYVSPAYEQVWGRPATEIYTDLTRFLEFVHPDDRDRVQAGWQQCHRMGFSQEYRVMRPDGTIVWIHDRGFPIYDDRGKLLWLGGIAEDITERKQAETAIAADLRDTRLLRDLSARLITETNIQVLYEEILTAAITLMGADAGALQFYDEATAELVLIAGQGFEPSLTEHFYRINASSHTPCGLALATGRRVVGDFDGPESSDPDGSRRMLVEAGYLSVQSTPLLTRTGKPIGMISTHWCQHHRPTQRELRFLDLLARQAADLIEQRQAEAERQQLLERERSAREEAERTNRIKDEFLSVLSHELRSPLNPILGWSKLLQTRKLDQSKTAKALATIERSAKVQTQLIEDLLDIARILRGKLSLNLTTVDLAVVVEAAIETVKTAATAKSIALQLASSPLGQVSGDPVRLQQIVWNLLSNAIKFTPPGGRVEIQLEQVENQAQITVSDTGKGIHPDFLPHTFESFRQQDASITRQFGGLGLGLAIVRYLVEAHGGTITADSPGEGLGATFTVRLPLLEIEPELRSTQEQSDAELDLAGVRILAVDDEPNARELLMTVLTLYNAEVRIAASAREALTLLNSFQPDVLVSDIGMPEVDGYTLIQQIRALPTQAGREVNAIALTAYAREEDRQQALESGYQAHIAKPLEPEQLVQAIAALAREP